MIESLGLHHLALQARDVEGVARFYRELLGLTELARYTDERGGLRSIWLSLRSGGEAETGFLAVEKTEAALGPPGVGLSMLAVRIAAERRAEVEAALAARGLAVERRTRWTVYVRDPEGNLLGLSHHPNDAEPVL